MPYRLALCAFLLAIAGAVPSARAQAEYQSDIPKQPPAAAPSTNHSELQEIVVSARRKEELLTTVPASITAYTSDFLQKQNIQNFVDYATRIPNVTFQYGQATVGLWGDSRETTIRGVAGVGTTAYYINDTPVPSTVSPQTLDLERIEVLKGPQGTLFGASSMGGNLRFITKKPSLEDNTGSVQLQGGGTRNAGFDFDNEAMGNFAVLPGRIGVDAALGYSHESGISTRTFPDPSGRLIAKDDQGAHDVFSGSVTVRGKISDSLEAALNFIGQSSYLHGFPAAYVPLPGYRPLSYTENRAQDVGEYSKEHWGLGAFVLNYSANGVSVVSSTSFFRRRLEEKEDDSEGTYSYFDSVGISTQGTPIGNAAFYNLSFQNSRLVTHESRLSFEQGTLLKHLSGTVGVFYQHEYSKFFIPTIPVQAMADTGLYPDNLGANSSVNTGNEKAVFGEFYYEVVPRLTVTLGLRKYWMDQQTTTGPNSGFIFGPVPYTDPPTSDSQSGLIPKGVVSYKVGDAGNIYASVSKGFRAGGANQALPSICAQDLLNAGLNQNDILRYRSDTLWNYEVGAKNRFRDGKLTASVAAFEMDWSKIQQTDLLPICELSFQTNAGKARIRGGELELSGQPLGDMPLSIQVGLGYTNAVLIDPGFYPQAPDTRLNQVPQWTGTISGYYEKPLTNRVHLFVASDYSYTDAVHVANNIGGYYLRQPFNMVNGNVGISFGRHQVLLYGKNLLDKRLNFGDQVSSGFERQQLLPDGTYQRLPRAVVSRPRQLGLQYQVNF